MPSTKKPLTPAADPAPELRPDGWERFEDAVDAAMKRKGRVTSKKSDRHVPEGLKDTQNGG